MVYGLVGKAYRDFALRRCTDGDPVDGRLPGKVQVLRILSAAECGRRDIVQMRREIDVGNGDVFEPDALQAGAAVAVIVGGRPVSVNAFQHLMAILERAATERGFGIKIDQVQIAGSRAIVRTNGETNRFGRRVFVAKNEFVATIAQTWGYGVKHFQRTRTEIARSRVPHGSGYVQSNLVAGERVGQLLSEGIVQGDRECPWTRTVCVGSDQQGRDERLSAWIEGHLQPLIAGKGALCQRWHAQPTQQKQWKKPPDAVARNRNSSKYRHRM